MEEAFDPSKYPPERLLDFVHNRPKKGDPEVKICIHHMDAHLDITFHNTDEGNLNVARMMASYPNVLAHVLKEIAIQQEVDGLDKDLLDLLADGEEA
jgi:hypothetical protein